MPLSSRPALLAALALLSVSTASLPARAARPVIAVFSIEDRGVGLSSSVLGRLSDFLAMHLASTGAYQLVPRDQLKQRLVQQKQQSYRSCYRASCQISIGKELAAQKSLATSILRLGSRCMVTAVMYDLRRAASEGGASVAGGCSEDGIVNSLQSLVTKLVPKSKVSTPRANKPRDRGGLLVKTRPAGARARIDGVALPGRTPLTLTDLAAGEHLLEIERGEYRYTGRVTVKADRFETIELTLEKPRVQLEVISDPPEATLLLNGSEMGQTPLVLPSVSVGEHLIELQKTGYLSKSHPIRLAAGTKRQQLRLTLEPAATLRVNSKPAGARVLVDDQEMGVTPSRLTLPAGRYRVRVEGAGRVAARHSVQLTKGQQVSLMLRLPAAATSPQGPDDVGPDRWKTITGWSAVGLGAALLGTCVTLGVLANRKADEHNQAAADRASYAELRQLEDQSDALRTGAVATGITGGVVAAAGGALLIWSALARPERPGRASRLRWAAWLDESNTGLTLAGSF